MSSSDGSPLSSTAISLGQRKARAKHRSVALESHNNRASLLHQISDRAQCQNLTKSVKIPHSSVLLLWQTPWDRIQHRENICNQNCKKWMRNDETLSRLLVPGIGAVPGAKAGRGRRWMEWQRPPCFTICGHSGHQWSIQAMRLFMVIITLRLCIRYIWSQCGLTKECVIHCYTVVLTTNISDASHYDIISHWLVGIGIMKFPTEKKLKPCSKPPTRCIYIYIYIIIYNVRPPSDVNVGLDSPQ